MLPLTPELEALCHEVAAALLTRGWRLATAESCTGGWVSAALTSLPGSSRWFEGGVVSYANAVKIGLLGVSPDVLAERGAVSEPVALQMAAGVLQALNVDIAVSITGIAGPDGGSAEKPVGTVCFAWATTELVEVKTCHFAGDREQVRLQAVMFALDGVLERAQQFDVLC